MATATAAPPAATNLVSLRENMRPLLSFEGSARSVACRAGCSSGGGWDIPERARLTPRFALQTRRAVPDGSELHLVRGSRRHRKRSARRRAVRADRALGGPFSPACWRGSWRALAPPRRWPAGRDGAGSVRIRRVCGMRPAGIEPAACGLKDRCSLTPRREPLTTELRARAGDVLRFRLLPTP
jgi:hypothetical protein